MNQQSYIKYLIWIIYFIFLLSLIPITSFINNSSSSSNKTEYNLTQEKTEMIIFNSIFQGREVDLDYLNSMQLHISKSIKLCRRCSNERINRQESFCALHQAELDIYWDKKIEYCLKLIEERKTKK